MFKLLIVDDFFVERENAREIIEASGLPVILQPGCCDGLEALSSIERDLPDFVLADIEMPFMNGLELAEVLNKKYPDVQVAFFSFHSNFDYAKKAINLNAHAYILKPIDKEELVALVRNLIEEKNKSVQKRDEDERLKRLLEESRPIAVAQFVRSLFVQAEHKRDEILARAAYWGVSLPEGYISVLVVEAEVSNAHEDTRYCEMLGVRLLSFLNEDNECRLFSNIYENRWAIVVNGDTNPSCTQHALDVAVALSERYSQDQLSVAISLVSENREEISLLYRQAVKALDYRFGLGKGCIIAFSDLEVDATVISLDLNNLFGWLREVMPYGDVSILASIANDALSSLPRNANPALARDAAAGIIFCLQMVLSEAGVTAKFLDASLLNIAQTGTLDEIRGCLHALFERSAVQLSSEKRQTPDKLVTSVMELINKEFYKKISVNAIAESLHYNPNYLNNAYKQATGQTILEYLTQVRMEKAKELLINSVGMRVSDVCAAVGYGHEAYFRKVFVEYVGFSPKEYREQALAGR